MNLVVLIEIFFFCVFSSLAVCSEALKGEFEQIANGLHREINAKIGILDKKKEKLDKDRKNDIARLEYFSEVHYGIKSDNSLSPEVQALLRHFRSLSGNCASIVKTKCFEDIGKIMDDDYQSVNEAIYRVKKALKYENEAVSRCVERLTITQIPCMNEVRNNFKSIVQKEGALLGESNLVPTRTQKLFSEWMMCVPRKRLLP